MAIAVTNQVNTLTLNDYASVTDVFKSLISVFSEGNMVTVQWSQTGYSQAPYNEWFASDGVTPLGGSATSVESVLAGYLQTGGGGGGGGGTINTTPPQVAFATGTSTLGGDATFTFSSSTKVMSVNGIVLNNLASLPLSPTNGQICQVLGVLYAYQGSQWNEISLT